MAGVAGSQTIVDTAHPDFFRVLRGEDTFVRFARQAQALPLSRAEWEASTQHAYTSLLLSLADFILFIPVLLGDNVTIMWRRPPEPIRTGARQHGGCCRQPDDSGYSASRLFPRAAGRGHLRPVRTPGPGPSAFPGRVGGLHPACLHVTPAVSGGFHPFHTSTTGR